MSKIKLGNADVNHTQKGENHTIVIEIEGKPTTTLKYSGKTLKLTGEAISWAEVQKIVKVICGVQPVEVNKEVKAPTGRVVKFGNVEVRQQVGESTREFYNRCTKIRKQNNIGFMRREAS